MAVDFYTIPQQITLVITSLISGSVSLLGSLTIIYIIWRDRRKKLKFVYHRVLFAMSLIDCVASLNFAFGFLLVPQGIFWGAQGNTASCEASGFLATFSRLKSLQFWTGNLLCPNYSIWEDTGIHRTLR
ncbi:hypothetical protein MHU86_24025 [Fragilaria crotonensis]|nr:hypothetical protein MHU86_24025 [Fragilaria crotonensis]